MFTDIDNVTMVKESTGDLDRKLRIKQLTGDALPFYNGSNPLILDALTAGASGWCTAAPNLRPQPCLDLYAATQAGDYDAAKAIYDDLSPLLRFIVAGGLPTTVKAGLDILGTKVGDPRPPLLPLEKAGLDELRSLLVD
jgi:4-hydroxy-tetrahydrodipicolinate synthase